MTQTPHVITANVEIAGKGSNIDNSLGEINISDIIYKQNDLVYSKKQINITSSIKDSFEEYSIRIGYCRCNTYR